MVLTMTIRLTLKRECKVPVTANNINPDSFNEKSLAEINNLTIWEGNHRIKLGTLFKISETSQKSSQATTIELIGDLRHVCVLAIQRAEVDLVGRDGQRPDDALFVMVVLDDRRQQSPQPDAVAAHDYRL